MPGLTLHGFLYELRMPGLPMDASGGSASDGDEGEGWPTPRASDGAKGSPNQKGSKGDMMLPGAVMQAWSTVTADDANNVTRTSGAFKSLSRDVQGWATPASRDFRYPNALSYAERGGGSKGEQLPNQVKGALNPAWVELLMGWPLGWTDAAAPCPGTWPGWPMGLGPDQHPYEPPRIAPKGSVQGRVARIKACGNGVVPQQAEAAFLLILGAAAPFLERSQP